MYYTPEFHPINWPPEVSQDAIQVVNFANQGFHIEVEANPQPEEKIFNEQTRNNGTGCPAMVSLVFS